MSRNQERTVRFEFFMSPSEAAIVERMAKRENVPIATYVRGALIADAVMAGDVGAMKLSGHRLREAMANKLRGLLQTESP